MAAIRIPKPTRPKLQPKPKNPKQKKPKAIKHTKGKMPRIASGHVRRGHPGGPGSKQHIVYR